MAITFRAAGTVGTAATTSVSLSQPTGTTTGDLLLAFVIDHATSGSSAAPTGWTSQGGAAGTGGRFQVFSAIVGSGGLTGTSWSFTGLTSTVEGCITGWFNTDLNVPMDVTVSGRVNASGTTGTTSITPVSANNMVVGGFAALAADSTLNSPTTATLGSLSNSAVNYLYRPYITLSVAYVPQAVAGSTGDSSVTMATAGANAALLLSIKPLTAVTLTGTSSASAAGSTTDSGNASNTLTGTSSASTAGTVVPSGSGGVSLAGAAITMAAGLVIAGVSAAVLLSGAAAVTSAGLVTPSGTAAHTIVGSACASSPGTVVPSADSWVYPLGASSATQAGSVSESDSANVDLIGSYVSLAAGVVTATAETDGSVSISGVEAGSNPGIVLASWFPAPQWMYSYPSSELVDAVANDTYPDDYRFLAAGLVKGRLISKIYATERKTLSIWVEIWSARSPQFVYFFSNANPIPPQPNNSV